MNLKKLVKLMAPFAMVLLVSGNAIAATSLSKDAMSKQMGAQEHPKEVTKGKCSVFHTCGTPVSCRKLGLYCVADYDLGWYSCDDTDQGSGAPLCIYPNIRNLNAPCFIRRSYTLRAGGCPAWACDTANGGEDAGITTVITRHNTCK